MLLIHVNIHMDNIYNSHRCTFMCTSTLMHAHISTCVHAHACMHMHTHVDRDTCTHKYMHAYTHLTPNHCNNFSYAKAVAPEEEVVTFGPSFQTSDHHSFT